MEWLNLARKSTTIFRPKHFHPKAFPAYASSKLCEFIMCLFYVSLFILHFCERRLEAVWPSYELHLSNLGLAGINAKGNIKAGFKNKCDQNSCHLNLLLNENCSLDSLAAGARACAKKSNVNQHFAGQIVLCPANFGHTGKMSAGSIFQFNTPAAAVKM